MNGQIKTTGCDLHAGSEVPEVGRAWLLAGVDGLGRGAWMAPSTGLVMRAGLICDVMVVPTYLGAAILRRAERTGTPLGPVWQAPTSYGYCLALGSIADLAMALPEGADVRLLRAGQSVMVPAFEPRQGDLGWLRVPDANPPQLPGSGPAADPVAAALKPQDRACTARRRRATR